MYLYICHSNAVHIPLVSGRLDTVYQKIHSSLKSKDLRLPMLTASRDIRVSISYLGLYGSYKDLGGSMNGGPIMNGGPQIYTAIYSNFEYGAFQKTNPTYYLNCYLCKKDRALPVLVHYNLYPQP